VAEGQIDLPERQIFVDDSGRRARRVHVAGLMLVVVCTCWLGSLLVGMAGFTSFPALTTRIAPVVLHHVLAARPTDRDRSFVSTERSRPRARPIRLARASHPPESSSA
jgi:hypothetical protein